MSEEISILENQAKRLEKQRQISQKIQKMMHQARSDYLAQAVESIPLLQGEKQRVELLAKQFSDNPSLKERILFLNSDQNKIRFERVKESAGSYMEYRLARPVQMDLSDLRKFLEAAEGDRYDASQGKPFLLLKKFDLQKCYEKGDEKVYSIYVELLQKL